MSSLTERAGESPRISWFSRVIRKIRKMFAKKTSDAVLAAAIEKVARTFKDEGPVYADLSGVVLDKQQYLDRLRHDSEFAAQQIPALIEPPDTEDNGITPREQQNIARRYLEFKRAGKGSLAEFLRAHPALADSYSVGDLRRVIDTLRLEYKVEQALPQELKEAEDEQRLAAVIGL